MSSKEILIKELENLNPLEILQLRSYIHQLKSHKEKSSLQKPEVDMDAVRKAFSSVKGSMADFISSEREDRI